MTKCFGAVRSIEMQKVDGRKGEESHCVYECDEEEGGREVVEAGFLWENFEHTKVRPCCVCVCAFAPRHVAACFTRPQF